MDIKKVGKAIAYLRKRAGYTQKDLAEFIGISDKAVSKWERGLGLPDVAYISKLAVILDTDAETLLAGDVIYHDKGWNGLLILPDNPCGIGAGTMIYDKPLVYYLLSNFLLVGIKTIFILCGQKDAEHIESCLGDGSRLGINLYYNSLRYEDILNSIDLKMDCSNVMAIYGRTLLYGVNQTRCFQRIMSYKEQVTVLSVPRNYALKSEEAGDLDDKFGVALSFNDKKKIVETDCKEKIITMYDYYPIPILFCPKRMLSHIIINDCNGNVKINTRYSELRTLSIYTETLNRGYFDIQIDTPDDLFDTSNFIRAIQKVSGMNIGCIEEIAWRRGMISLDEMKKYALEKADTEHGKYLLRLCSKS